MDIGGVQSRIVDPRTGMKSEMAAVAKNLVKETASQPETSGIRPASPSILQRISSVLSGIAKCIRSLFSGPSTSAPERPVSPSAERSQIQIKSAAPTAKVADVQAASETAVKTNPREARLTGVMQEMIRMSPESLQTFSQQLSQPTSDVVRSLSQNGLTDADIQFLKKSAESIYTLSTQTKDIGKQKSIDEFMNDAMAIMTRLSTPQEGVGRTFTVEESRALLKPIVLNAHQELVSSKTGSQEIKETISKLDTSAKTLLPKFNISTTDLSPIRQTATTHFCTAVKAELLTQSHAEILSTGKEIIQTLKTLEIPESDAKSVLKSVKHMGQFATAFVIGADPMASPASDNGRRSSISDPDTGKKTANFNSISAENRSAILAVLNKTDGDKHIVELLGKLGATSTTLSSEQTNLYLRDMASPTRPSDSYETLRLVADHRTDGIKGESDYSVNKRFDSGIEKFGAALEDTGKIPMGYTKASMSLRNLMLGLSKTLSNTGKTPENDRLMDRISAAFGKKETINNLGGLLLTKETITAIKANFNIEKADTLLAQIIDLQDKMRNGLPLTDPPSTHAMATIRDCGLIPKNVSEDKFMASINSGIKSHAEVKILLAKLDKFTKEISGNYQMTQLMDETLSKNPAAMLEHFVQRFSASKGEANSNTTLLERIGNTAKAIKDVATSPITMISSTIKKWSLAAQGKEPPAIQKYTKKIESAQAQIKQLQGQIKDKNDQILSLTTLEKTNSASLRQTEQDLAKLSPDRPFTRQHVQMAQNITILRQEVAQLGTPSTSVPMPSVFSGGRSGFNPLSHKISNEHVQLAQNLKLIDTEAQTLKQPSARYATTESAEVTQHILEKQSYMRGAASDGAAADTTTNHALKHAMSPGMVKLNSENQLCYVSQSRGPDGTITERTIGVLTQAQAQDYATQLAAAKNDVKSSTTKDLMTQLSKSGSSDALTSAETNRYLAQFQESTAVTAAIKEKLSFLETGFSVGDLSKGDLVQRNKTMKSEYMPGVVRPNQNGQLEFFKLSRGADGSISEKSIGLLSAEQAKDYTDQLSAAAKTLPNRSKGATAFLEATTGKPLTTDSTMNLYLSAPQRDAQLNRLKSVIQDHKGSISTLESAQSTSQANLKKEVTDANFKDKLDEFRCSIAQELLTHLASGKPIDTALDQLSQKVSDTFSDVKTPEVSELVALLKHQISQLGDADTRNTTIKSWMSDIMLSQEAEAKLHLDETYSGYEKTKAASQQAIEGLSPNNHFTIDFKTLISANISSLVTQLTSPVSVGTDIRAASSIGLTMTRQPQTPEKPDTLVASLKMEKGAEATMEFSFIKNITTAFTGGASLSDGINFEFSSSEKAAEFIAALRSGDTETAFASVSKFTTTSGKTLTLGASVTAGYTSGVSRDLGDINTSAGKIGPGEQSMEIIFGANLSLSGKFETHTTTDETSRLQSTTRSETVNYAHNLGIGIQVGGKGKSASDQQQFKIERSVRVDTDLDIKDRMTGLRGYQTSEAVQFDVNSGKTYAKTSDKTSIIETQLSHILSGETILSGKTSMTKNTPRISMDNLSKRNPDMYQQLSNALQHFEPTTDRLVVVKTLKSDVVDRLALPSTSEETYRDAIANMDNYDIEIQLETHSSDSVVSRDLSLDIKGVRVAIKKEGSVSQAAVQSFNFNVLE